MPSQNSGLTSSADNSARTWDGSPHTKYEWFESLQHFLTSKDISYRTLWQSGYIVDRTKVLVCNAAHAQHLSIGNVKKLPFEEPTTLFNFKLVDATKDVSKTEVDPARYVIAPEMLDAKDRSLFAAIADTLDNKKRREDYERKTDGSGLEFIKLLAREIDQASAEISQWAARRLADVVAAGLSAPTTVGFDIFRKQYEEANNQLPSTRRNQPSVIADTYVSAVRQLGDNIGTRLDMQLTLSRIAKGGDKKLNLEETVNCILDILGDSELRQTGHALKANRDNRPPLVWTDGKHEICSICKGKHGGGKHLRRDCPDKPTDPIKRPKPDRAPPREPAGKGAAKRAVASEESDDSMHDLWEADTPLAALFTDELDSPSNAPSEPPSNEHNSDSTGSALVAQAARGRPRTGENESISTPRPSVAEARRMVERLSPVSPMKEFTETERAIGSGVSLRTGGSDRRSRIEILGEMRAAVGLSPVVIPVGLPVGSPPPAPLTDARGSAPTTPNPAPSSNAEPTRVPSALPSDVVTTPVADSSDAPLELNPLGLTQEPGAPTLVGFAIKVDDHGRIVHELLYTFNYSEKRSWTHLAAKVSRRPRPPPRSVFLGRSSLGRESCWGSESGELILCPEDVTESSNRLASDPTIPSPSEPKELGRSLRTPSPRPAPGSSSSPVRNLAVAVLSLAGALAAVALGAGSSGGVADHPFDPGARSTAIDPYAGAITTMFLALIGSLLARQANRRGGRRGGARRSAPTAPSSTPSVWEPLYQRDLSDSTQRLVHAAHTRRIALTVWLSLHWATLRGLCTLAVLCNLRASTLGCRRPMLPDTKLCRNQHQAVKLLATWCALSAIYSGAFITEPAFVTAVVAVTHSSAFRRAPPRRCSPLGAERLSSFQTTPVDDQPSDEIDRSMNAAPSVSRGYSLRSSKVSFRDTEGPQRHRNSRERTRLDSCRPPPETEAWTRRRWVDLVIDSGCTWHIHNRLDELINLRACHDVVEDAAGNRVACTQMGDLPLLIRSSHGVEFCFLLRNVRCAPNFPDSLVSVDQLWAASKADCVFRDELHVKFTLNFTNRGEPLTSSFRRVDGLYRWSVAVARPGHLKRAAASTKSLKPGIHAAGSTSRLSTIPSDSLAALLHRRLHVGLSTLRRLGELSSDAPSHIHSASTLSCTHCAEANSTRLSHSASSYEPTHPGRLIHMDIAGPFKPSKHGGYRYCMILVDDHSRFKFIHFLHRRSDARDKVKRFVTEFNALASQHSSMPVRKVGKLRSDNAGEFVSREFAEMLDDLGVSHSTSPPYVHQLNGVAERAIRSVFSLTRSYLTASGLPAEFWTHAAEMAVEVLNRTSGPPPPHHERTSYELMTGRRPRILEIMPFGCRAFAVKPREQYSKTTVEPRAWVGVNLGRSSLSPGAYKIWCPSTGRVVIASDAYFMEHVYPRRPKGFQIDDEVGAVPTTPPQPENEGVSVSRDHSNPRAGRVLSASREASGDRARRALLLFSGSESRPDGLAAMLRRRGVEVVCVDNDPAKNEQTRDILNDSCFLNLLEQAKRGEFDCVLAAPPCSTYSVSRYFKPSGQRSGAPVVRSRQHVLGLPNLPPGHDKEVRQANEITRRTCAILSAAHSAGAEFVIENPADRGDASFPHLFQFAEHAPIWLDPHMVALRKAVHLSSATFAQCMVGGPSQKYTTLWYTGGACSLDHLRGLNCAHAPGSHAQTAGGVYDEDLQQWNSAQAAAYPMI